MCINSFNQMKQRHLIKSSEKIVYNYNTPLISVKIFSAFRRSTLYRKQSQAEIFILLVCCTAMTLKHGCAVAPCPAAVHIEQSERTRVHIEYFISTTFYKTSIKTQCKSVLCDCSTKS